jgi:hypothetical protein
MQSCLVGYKGSWKQVIFDRIGSRRRIVWTDLARLDPVTLE